MFAALALAVALAADRIFGEPPARWHPVVWMGRYLAWAAPHVAPRAGETARPVRHFLGGALAWWVGAIALVVLAWFLTGWLFDLLPSWAGALLLGLLLKPMLAWRMLRDEVATVEAALGQSLDAGRARLAMLVSRDVAVLDAVQVRESAIESLAENLNDSVVAPLFWFVLLGLPGAVLYRFANTADAMWGYRGLRNGRDWTWAGKWTARADDVLSWLPARLTALLLGLAAGRLPWRKLAREAARTPSPNSGWPMAAMALALDVHLRKPGVYTLHGEGRAAAPEDTARAIQLAGRAVVGAALCGMAVCWAVLPW